MNTFTTKMQSDLLSQKKKLFDSFQEQPKPYCFFAEYFDLLNTFLVTLWEKIVAEPSLCLVAIGGFGRKEVYPYSDLDMAIIFDGAISPEVKGKISFFIESVWDIGLHPAAITGSIEQLCDAAKQELKTDTSFIESTYLAGNPHLLKCLLNKLDLQRDKVVFFDGKILEVEGRHDKFNISNKQLEPDVKNCLGGLRDMHSIIWLARVQGIDADLVQLLEKNILNKEEISLLVEGHKFLAMLRIYLHILSGKNNNSLFFNYQEEIARKLGYKNSKIELNSEHLMQSFYQATKTVKQLYGILLPMLKNRVYTAYPRQVFPINENYYQVGDLIAAYDKNIFKKNKVEILKIIKILQKNRNISSLAPKTLRSWWSAVQKIDEKFLENPVNQKNFIDLFKNKDRLYSLLQFLNLYGFLGKYLPDFGKIIGLLQNDLFHIFPVDDHILMVVKFMKRLDKESYNYDFPAGSNLMSQFDRPYILYLAALFHDIGKGRGGNHDLIGAKIAEDFAQKHHMEKKDQELLVWLVQHHLLMSITSQKKDIYNNDIIRDFCVIVNTPRKLIALYLLTVSDIRGTDPRLWNAWKANLLELLFQYAMRYLSGEIQDQKTLFVENKDSAKKILLEKGFDVKNIDRLFKLLGDQFFIGQTNEHIEWQLLMIARDPKPDSPKFDTQLSGGMLEILFYSPFDRNTTMICRIASYLNLNIVRAKTYLTNHHFSVENFIISFPENFNEFDKALYKEKVINYLNKLILNQLSEEELTASKPAVLSLRSLHSRVTPKISLVQEKYKNNEKGFYSLSIVAVNRNGLLANIMDILSENGCTIILTTVSTLAERAEDQFLLYSDYLDDIHEQTKLKNKLLQCISL